MTPAHHVVRQIDVVESYQAFRPCISVGQNQSQVDIAKLVRRIIKEHLTLLADIDKGGMRG
jgi:hypothetical protein